MNESIMNMICYEPGRWWTVLLCTSLLWSGLLWTWAVM